MHQVPLILQHDVCFNSLDIGPTLNLLYSQYVLTLEITSVNWAVNGCLDNRTEGGKILKYNFPHDLLFSAVMILDIGHNEVRGFLPTDAVVSQPNL